MLGDAYENGRGVDRDLARAAEWYQKASLQGHLEARRRLILLLPKLQTPQ